MWTFPCGNLFSFLLAVETLLFFSTRAVDGQTLAGKGEFTVFHNNFPYGLLLRQKSSPLLAERETNGGTEA
jgi:hypothetical protein